jgi:hypothetical protein
VLSVRWPAASDTAFYVQELKATILRDISTVGDTHEPSAYDINLLAELDFLVTQRRIHSIYHQNITVPTEEGWMQSEPQPSGDVPSPFPDDMWREFINTGFDFDAGDDPFYFGPAGDNHPVADSIDASVDTVQAPAGNSPPVHGPAVDIETLIDAIPACGYCRNQHLKCDREFPSCRICKRSLRQCTYFDVVLQQDILRRCVIPTIFFHDDVLSLFVSLDSLLRVFLAVTSTIYVRDSSRFHRAATSISRLPLLSDQRRRLRMERPGSMAFSFLFSDWMATTSLGLQALVTGC